MDAGASCTTQVNRRENCIAPSQSGTDVDGTHLAYIFDLILEDDRLNVYAGELEVRPPPAPTTEPVQGSMNATVRDRASADGS